MTSLRQSGPLLEKNIPFHSGNTFLDLFFDKQGNEPNLLRELKIRLTTPLPFQFPNPILRNLISNSKWIQMSPGQSLTTLIHKTVPTYLKRLFIVYTDDGIFASISKGEIDTAIHEMKQLFNLEDQGDIKDYLGVNVEHMANGDIKLALPHLVKQIVDKLKLPL
jgi:hypothetical protein